jgi:1-acyl-sn-glycerol-3-phosphate acyltransferase
MADRADRRSIPARLAQASLRALGGWRFVGDAPRPRKAVCLAVPHTDNMDGALLVLLAQSVGMKISWMIKDTWGKPPVGWLVHGLGGVTIDRSKPNGVVGQMIEAFARRDDLYLVIPPEGTRKRVEHWKSGFYHIALGASVPVVPGFLDYRNKQGWFGEPITLTGNVRADMDVLREVYAGVATMARHPEMVGPIRLREEEDEAPAA